MKKNKSVVTVVGNDILVGRTKVQHLEPYQNFLTMLKAVAPEHHPKILSQEGEVFKATATLVYEARYKKHLFEPHAIMGYVKKWIHRVVQQWESICLTIDGIYEYVRLLVNYDVKLPKPAAVAA